MKNKLITDIPLLDSSESVAPHTEAHTPCTTPKITEDNALPHQRKLYIESFGCQMNFSDSEIVASVMLEHGFGTTSNHLEADLIFLNTCAIRDKAEQTIRKRLMQFNVIKRKRPDLLIGILGCMAERLKHKLLEEEKLVDLVAGPDAYRDLPNLVFKVDDGQKALNVLLSREETYADIAPVRLNSNGISAFISIMRGCDNMCTFCVVPFTRGRERSRSPYTILAEAQELFDKGYREVTLLGQNVDSYKWTNLERGQKLEELQEPKIEVNFAQLLEMVAKIHPDLRVRFTTSHPKDMTDEVLQTMAAYENICKYIHLPIQSGNNRILKLMNRNYTREWYLERIAAIRRILGNECGLSTDIISGFCTETEAEHQDTVSLMDAVQFDMNYMFAYSERPGTLAAKKYADDISPEIKRQRLEEIISHQREHGHNRNKLDVGSTQKILVDGYSRRSQEHLQGRTSSNKVVVFPKENAKIGEYVMVYIEDCSSGTLLGRLV
ncbi:MAG: tRNA (N6-isopentenyl adenosine(37)-C2)-methylthiotransferase MiaB [Cytophagales bacterium]|nr:MAG: tRNA (N6-isopentenyl adenosine(37)-C2)-methylthiotransferase MiaB [Cytophagales bacterium]TAF60267.1 MAG: tRNA (N6-isopentenyl adenosine(37)-C2)-methylthiotransferase MiaB [Cytophagales bacterium]